MDSIEKLEKLTTKRLLAYYKAERKRRKLYPYMPSYGYEQPVDVKAWDQHLLDVKAMLDEREHVERKK